MGAKVAAPRSMITARRGEAGAEARIFSGLMSRCMQFLEWINARPERACAIRAVRKAIESEGEGIMSAMALGMRGWVMR